MEEMAIEFFEDHYLDDRKRLWRDEKEEYGDIQLPDIGDPLIDRWEEQFSKGTTPDLTEGLPEKLKQKFLKTMAEVDKETERKRIEEEKRKLDQFFAGPSDSEMYAGFADNYRT